MDKDIDTFVHVLDTAGVAVVENAGLFDLLQPNGAAFGINLHWKRCS